MFVKLVALVVYDGDYRPERFSNFHKFSVTSYVRARCYVSVTRNIRDHFRRRVK